MEIKNFIIKDTEDGLRLDRWFHRNIPDMPFKMVAKLSRKGQIRVDSKRIKVNFRLKENQKLRVPVVVFEDNVKQKEVKSVSKDLQKKITDSIVFEDERIIAINKPENLCVQGGTRVKISLRDILTALKYNVYIVHRLDKATSGVVIFAKSAEIAAKLGLLFKNRNIKKEYIAILTDIPRANSSTIESYEEGCYAKTKYEVISKNPRKNLCLVKFFPVTGRKHQIRQHALKMQSPILGDNKYKRRGKDKEVSTLYLHAHKIKFDMLGKVYDISTNLPSYFTNKIDSCF